MKNRHERTDCIRLLPRFESTQRAGTRQRRERHSALEGCGSGAGASRRTRLLQEHAGRRYALLRGLSHEARGRSHTLCRRARRTGVAVDSHCEYERAATIARTTPLTISAPEHPHAGITHNVSTKPAAPVAAGTIYTCPMHPEVRQVGPGTLPHLRHDARAADADARSMTTARYSRSNATSGSLPRSAYRWSLIAMLPHRARSASARSAPSGVLRATELLLDVAGRRVGGCRLLPPRLARRRQSIAEHVHPDRPRRAGRVRLQPLRDIRAERLPARDAGFARHGRCLFRSRRCDHCARAPRRVAGACAPAAGRVSAIRQLLGLAPKTARRVKAGRHGRRRAARAACGRRSGPRAARREGARRRTHSWKAAPPSMNRC